MLGLGSGRTPRPDRLATAASLGLAAVGLGLGVHLLAMLVRRFGRRDRPPRAGRLHPAAGALLAIALLAQPLFIARGVARWIPTDLYIGLIARNPGAWTLGDWWEVTNRPLAPSQADRLVDALLRAAGPDEPFHSATTMHALLPKASSAAMERYLRAAWDVEIRATADGKVEVRARTDSPSAARRGLYPKVLLGSMQLDGANVHPPADTWAAPQVPAGTLPRHVCVTRASFRAEPSSFPGVVRAEYWIRDCLEAGWSYLEGPVWAAEDAPDTAGGLLHIAGPFVVEREIRSAHP